MDLQVWMSGNKYVGEFMRVLHPLLKTSMAPIDIDLRVAKYNDLMQATLFLAAVQYAKSNGRDVSVDVGTPSRYLQRMNFYDELGIDLPEKFSRHDADGRLMEFCNINSENDTDVVNSIMCVIEAQNFLEDSVLGCLNYCFWEMVDNIRGHAESNIGGYSVVQHYPADNRLEINLVDAGRGIQASLKESERYREISEIDALKTCIVKGATNGVGLGNGLYHTTNFIKENRGLFQLYSGNHVLKVTSDGTDVLDHPFWHGTAIHMEIQTQNGVDLKKIFGDEIPTSVEEARDCIHNLW